MSEFRSLFKHGDLDGTSDWNFSPEGLEHQNNPLGPDLRMIIAPIGMDLHSPTSTLGYGGR